jgi:hypothetical protein
MGVSNANVDVPSASFRGLIEAIGEAYVRAFAASRAGDDAAAHAAVVLDATARALKHRDARAVLRELRTCANRLLKKLPIPEHRHYESESIRKDIESDLTRRGRVLPTSELDRLARETSERRERMHRDAMLLPTSSPFPSAAERKSLLLATVSRAIDCGISAALLTLRLARWLPQSGVPCIWVEFVQLDSSTKRTQVANTIVRASPHLMAIRERLLKMVDAKTRAIARGTDPVRLVQAALVALKTEKTPTPKEYFAAERQRAKRARRRAGGHS